MLTSSYTNNQTTRSPSNFSLHLKVPRFISESFEAANSLRNWTHLLTNPANENINVKKHSKIFQRTYRTPAGFSARIRSHPQKNKGSTGKAIQRERNEASKIRMASTLYGEDYELEL